MSKKKLTTRIKPIIVNGKKRFIIEKLIVKFLFFTVWKQMVDQRVSPPTPMEFNTIEKAVQRQKNLAL